MGWTWKQICADPTFTSLPNRVESDEWGNAVVLPMVNVHHSERLSEVLRLLNQLLKNGDALPIVPVRTAKGVKAVDVAWLSKARRHANSPVDDTLVIAPEICVEVAARHNQRGEIAARLQLYFERGAVECWICDVRGRMMFHDATGVIPQSKICPKFPACLAVVEQIP